MKTNDIKRVLEDFDFYYVDYNVDFDQDNFFSDFDGNIVTITSNFMISADKKVGILSFKSSSTYEFYNEKELRQKIGLAFKEVGLY